MGSSKNVKLQTFIKANLEANAIVIIQNDFSDVISYNGFISFVRFKKHVEKLSTKALFSHINYLTSIQGDPHPYLSCIKHQIAEVMINIQQFDDFIFHKKINVYDRHDKSIPFDDLPLPIKQKIGAFVAIQHNCLISFLAKLNGNTLKTEPSNLTWLGTKTDLVELSNALYESGTIGSKNGNITKKEFMESFSSFMNIDIGATHKTLNKASLRNNPSQFIDKLKKSFNDYMNKKYES